MEVPVGWEHDGPRGLRLEDAAGVGRANRHPLADLEGDGEVVPARFLLEEVVVDLDAREVPDPHRRAALFEPAGSRPEGEPRIADLALRLEGLEGLPHARVRDRRDVRVVELEDVDVRGPDSGEARVDGRADPGGGEVRPAVPAARLRRNHDEFPAVPEGLPQEGLAAAARLRGGRVER